MGRINGMLRGFFFLFLNHFVLTAVSQTGRILPPQNVSLSWFSPFEPQLFWAPPQQSMNNCQYKVQLKYEEHKLTANESHVKTVMVMEGGFLEMKVKTECGSNSSELVVVNFTSPELVKDLNCYIHSPKQANCTWTPVSRDPGLGFYFQLFRKFSNTPPLPVQECPSHIPNGGDRTSCSLQETDYNKNIRILFNTTSNAMLRNTFERTFKYNPPALSWNVTPDDQKFIISWNPPDVASNWNFIINYTECNKERSKTENTATSTEILRKRHCPYRFAIKATIEDTIGETPWSDEKYFDAVTDSNAFLYAAVIIPLMSVFLVAMMFVYCKRNKDYILPKVPQPRDLLSDISDNNNKSTFGNLYTSSEEEDACRISLVIDPQNNNHDNISGVVTTQSREMS